MPRVSRKPKRRRDGYSQEHIRMLLDGVYFFACPFGTDRKRGPWKTEEMRAAWETLRRELLEEWIRKSPGTRPYAWWMFDAPERRRRVDGIVHPFDDRIRKEHVEEVAHRHPDFRELAYELCWGKPRMQVCQVDFGAKYESELVYLDRLNLLTEAERREIFG